MATKYQPLVDYIAAEAEGAVTLSFAEIEAIIGRPLSDTAYTSSDYWTAPRLVHVQRWRALGWSAHIDRRNRRVVFTRSEE